MRPTLPSGSPKLWCIVPAAGVGLRMQQPIPKQYTKIYGKTVLDHTLGALFEFEPISHIHLVLSSEDNHWEASRFARDSRVQCVNGSSERMYSVLNALVSIETDGADPLDWVLVHDAARPLIHIEDMRALYARIEGHEVGGLLGCPVAETLKRVELDQVRATADRSALWCAHTPQIFRFGLLYTALRQAQEVGMVLTDESQAIERVGKRPLMIQARWPNVKITQPQDLVLCERLMSSPN